MIKYKDFAITFVEIPEEISICLEITNCPHRCNNCHSPELRADIGKELTEEELDKLITKNDDSTCICFMGGDNNHREIADLACYIHDCYPDLKVAMYSGDDELDEDLLGVLDYYKIGPYVEELGPLNSKTTNQKLYYINQDIIEDITYKFWPKEN